MEVVLLEDVKALGKKGQIVKVNDGYARNFILPKKLGVEANTKNLNDLKLQKANEAKVAAEQLAEELALPCGSGTQVTCVIIRLRTAPEFVQPSPEEIYHGFHNLLQHYHSDCVYVAKKLQFLVYFIFSPDSFSSLMASDIQNFLEEQLVVLSWQERHKIIQSETK